MVLLRVTVYMYSIEHSKSLARRPPYRIRAVLVPNPACSWAGGGECGVGRGASGSMDMSTAALHGCERIMIDAALSCIAQRGGGYI